MDAQIAAAVIDWFAASRVAQKKHAAREWTVLAGVVLRVDGEEETLRVLACGTGTKCLGRRDLDADGFVVNDCHAEVMARRALVRYLYQEARYWSSSGATESSSIFTRNPETQKLRLRPQHELHLFISETPCGDAAIYPLQNAVVDALVERRTQREAPSETDTVERSELRLTGAKHQRTGDANAEHPQDKRFEQAVGVARVKSGRSDLPLEKQTRSMSCSDKIAVWNAVGWQGTLLQRWFDPVFMMSIVVAEDPASRSSAAQELAMHRALRDRLPNPPQNGRLSVLKATNSSTFSHARDSNKTPSPLSLNWTRHEPHWKSEATTGKSWQSSFFGSSDVEVVMAATGLREGAKKASKMDAAARQRVASRLSKWSLFRAYASVHTDAIQTYNHEKDAIVKDRNAVKRAIGEWVGVPGSFKAFQPHQ